MAHSEAEGETENDACLAGTVVALLRELFEEVVAAGHADFPERDVLEERQYERTHVALIEQSGRAGEAVFEFHVLQPVVDQGSERTVGAHPGEPGVEQRTIGELLLQRALRRGPRAGCVLDLSALPVPVAVAGARRVSPAGLESDGDGAVGADRGEQLVAVVADVPAELHIRWAGAGKPPVLDRPQRQPQQVGDLTRREEHRHRGGRVIHARQVRDASPHGPGASRTPPRIPSENRQISGRLGVSGHQCGHQARNGVRKGAGEWAV